MPADAAADVAASSPDTRTQRATTYEVVVIVASLGGLHTSVALLGALPADFPASVVLVQHHSVTAEDPLADLLDGKVSLSVVDARDGDAVRPGTVHVAPPEHQVVIDEGRRLAFRAPTAMSHHCAGDPLFESAAAVFGDRVLAVVLTGRLSDGAEGVLAVKRHGGTVLVQDEATADARGMPAAAAATGAADLVLPLEEIGPTIAGLVQGSLTLQPGRPGRPSGLLSRRPPPRG